MKPSYLASLLIISLCLFFILLHQSLIHTNKTFQESAIKAGVACYDETTGKWQFKSLDRISRDYVGIAANDGKPLVPSLNPALIIKEEIKDEYKRLHEQSFPPTQNIDNTLTAEQVQAEIEKEKAAKNKSK